VSEQDRSLAQMDEGDVDRHRHNHALVQEAIEEVAESSGDRDVPAVTAALQQALTRRGIPEQPARWLDAVAQELAAGRPYIEDLGTSRWTEHERRDEAPDPGRDTSGDTPD
jgi:hypothetical protein